MGKIKEYSSLYEWSCQSLESIDNSKSGELEFYKRSCLRLHLKEAFRERCTMRIALLGLLALSNALENWCKLDWLREKLNIEYDLVQVLKDVLKRDCREIGSSIDIPRVVYKSTNDLMIIIYEQCEMNSSKNTAGFIAPAATLSLIHEIALTQCNDFTFWEKSCKEKWTNSHISVEDSDVYGWVAFNLDSNGNWVPEDEDARIDYIAKKKEFWSNWISSDLKKVIELDDTELEKNIFKMLDNNKDCFNSI